MASRYSAVLTAAEFDAALASRPRTTKATASACRAVLVGGESPATVAAREHFTPQRLNRTLRELLACASSPRAERMIVTGTPAELRKLKAWAKRELPSLATRILTAAGD